MRRAPNFNGLARSYRWMERITFGQSLWKCRCAFLDEIASRRSALVLGDGDGRFTARLLEENHIILIDAVDASAAMLLELVRNAGPRASRVRVHHADARLWDPGAPRYDLIVSHFFLDCLSTKDVKKLVQQLRPCVTPGGMWMISEFAVPPGWFGWLVARPVITALYLAFGLLTGLTVFRLPRYHKVLSEAGFTLVERRTSLKGLLTSELWKLEPARPT
jgi:SAM-dependent methyltransferase